MGESIGSKTQKYISKREKRIPIIPYFWFVWSYFIYLHIKPKPVPNVKKVIIIADKK